MKKSLLLLVGTLLFTALCAKDKKIVECRLLTSSITECNPYPSRFVYTENLAYGMHKHKLIISKTLPKLKKPKIVKVISVEDMIERNLKVLEPVRYRNRHLSEIEKAEKEKQRREAYVRVIEADLSKLRAERVQLVLERNRLRKKINEITLLEEGRYKQARREEKEALEAAERQRKEAARKAEAEALEAKAREKKLAQEKKSETGNAPGTLSGKLKHSKKKKTHRRVLNEYKTKLLRVRPRGKHSLRVQATAYSSHTGQTDKTPFLAAWNNRIRPGMKIIAVSRDLIRKYGLGNGKKVRIQGLPGYYTVRDKMNKRFTKRIDIYMGTNRRKALRWGRRRTVIYW